MNTRPPIRIKIFSSFCSSTHAKKSLEKLITYRENMFNQDNTRSDDVYIVDENDETYTHVIIWNTAMPIIPKRIPKENVIGLACEPLVCLNISDTFIDYAIKNIHAYYLGDKEGLPDPFVEGNCYLTYDPPLLNVIPFKSSCMSMVVSNRTELSGHLYRHILLDYILYNNIPIDIYGNGTDRGLYKTRGKQIKSTRIKGPFKRYEPYHEYMFTICIENTRSKHYFSEKIINPLLSNTTPIYIGCENIESYFPNNVLHLTGDIHQDMNLLINILRDPAGYYKKIDTFKVEQKVSLIQNVSKLYGKQSIKESKNN